MESSAARGVHDGPAPHPRMPYEIANARVIVTRSSLDTLRPRNLMKPSSSLPSLLPAPWGPPWLPLLPLLLPVLLPLLLLLSLLLLLPSLGGSTLLLEASAAGAASAAAAWGTRGGGVRGMHARTRQVGRAAWPLEAPAGCPAAGGGGPAAGGGGGVEVGAQPGGFGGGAWVGGWVACFQLCAIALGGAAMVVAVLARSHTHAATHLFAGEVVGAAGGSSPPSRAGGLLHAVSALMGRNGQRPSMMAVGVGARCKHTSPVSH